MLGYLLYDNEGYRRNVWFSNELVNYAKSIGVTLKVIIREKLNFSMINSKLCPVYDGFVIDGPNFVINRCIDPFTAECFEFSGATVHNSANVCRICNDKRLTHAYFTRFGIQMADSIFINPAYDSPSPESYPVIIKSASGHGGSEVFMVNDRDELEARMKQLASPCLIQKPVSKLGRDLRVYVMGGKIICSVLRSCDKDFRSNFSLGGNAELYTMTKEQKDLVYKVVKCLPFTFGGIDFIFDGDKMLLNEIEDIVGSRMIYSLTDMPVHEMLIDQIVNSHQNRV